MDTVLEPATQRAQAIVLVSLGPTGMLIIDRPDKVVFGEGAVSLVDTSDAKTMPASVSGMVVVLSAFSSANVTLKPFWNARNSGAVPLVVGATKDALTIGMFVGSKSS